MKTNFLRKTAFSVLCILITIFCISCSKNKISKEAKTYLEKPVFAQEELKQAAEILGAENPFNSPSALDFISDTFENYKCDMENGFVSCTGKLKIDPESYLLSSGRTSLIMFILAMGKEKVSKEVFENEDIKNFEKEQISKMPAKGSIINVKFNTNGELNGLDNMTVFLVSGYVFQKSGVEKAAMDKVEK